MSWDYLVKDDYGQTLQITFIDIDTDAAADISGYTTTKSIILTDPSGNSATKTATFLTDGSDGIIQYPLVTGDIDEVGQWKARGRVATGSAVLTTEIHKFHVQP